MAVVDNAGGITMDATGQHMGGKLLDGLPAAVSAGQSTRYEQCILTNGVNPFVAAQSMGNQDLTGIKTSILNGVIDDGSSGTAKTIDWTTGGSHKIILTGNCTFTFTAPAGACWLQLRLTQDGTGSRTAVWPAMKWAGGAAPALTITPTTGTDIVSIWYDGAAYYGAALLNFA
jgi:hypothetical protein